MFFAAQTDALKLTLESRFRYLLRSQFGASESEFWIRLLGVNTSMPELWTEQFDDLVLFYPAIQAMPSVSPDSNFSQGALLAHLCLLVGAFSLDRLLDGQVSGEDVEALSTGLIDTGLASAFELSGRSPEFSVWCAHRIDQYKNFELGGYACPDSKFYFDLTHANAVASARGSFGLIVSMGVSFGLSDFASHLSKVEKAFDCVAIGLQYVDDVLDWCEDFANRDENLMLSLLSDRADWWNDSEFSDEQVIELRLKDSKLPHRCIETGIQWFDTAIELQGEIGAETMCAELERKRNAVAAMRV